VRAAIERINRSGDLTNEERTELEESGRNCWRTIPGGHHLFCLSGERERNKKQ
jgi:hypothetical protein